MTLTDTDTLAPKKTKKEETRLKMEKLSEELRELQAKLYAQSQHKVLIILQGMDASGKDGTIKNVFRGINPLGCRVESFKVPSALELSHDFLWRVHNLVPAKGIITIFNRSHYEDVLVPSVHKLLDKKSIENRYKHINNFERLLCDTGTLVLKFYLHISKEEQAKRLKERKTNPEKFWKHNDRDAVERRSWDRYMREYEEIFKRCNEVSKWHIVPADQNWYRDYHIIKTIVKEMRSLKLEYPAMIKKEK